MQHFENINKVGPDLPDDERERWIAEVKFFKAFYHYYLLRMYGPIPLIKENLPISAGIDEVKVYREPFDDCVDYIVELLDEAIEVLPLNIINIATEMGKNKQTHCRHIESRGSRDGCKPLFNGNEDYSTFTDNRGIKLLVNRQIRQNG